jgi:hypothetical protein
MGRPMATLGILLILPLAAAAGLAQGLAQGPDFDGDGFDDLVVGVAFEDVGTSPMIFDAGAVQVLYGSASGVSVAGDQVWTQNTAGVKEVAEPSDRFGWSAAWGDFDGDGFSDLAVGVLLENVGGVDGGAVSVLYGSPAGLTSTANQLWHQNVAGIADVAGASDYFGFALAVGDFDGDGRDDLAVGIPEEDLGASKTTAGAVQILYGSATGLKAGGSQFFTQDSPGVPGTAEGADRFGEALAAGNFDGDGFDDLAVGVAGENASAGATNTGSQLWTQQQTGGSSDPDDNFGGALAAGDFDGDGSEDLAIGIFKETVSGIDDAGAVNVLYGSAVAGLSSAGSQLWTQNSPGVEDTSEDTDLFGFALVAADFDGDGFADLAAGAPTESLSPFAGEAGMVNVLYGTAGGLNAAGDQIWNQSLLEGLAETDDHFGYALTAGDFDGDGFDDLIAGVPHEDLGSQTDAEEGALNVVYGSRGAGLVRTDSRFLHQDTPGVLQQAENGDWFGYGLR